MNFPELIADLVAKVDAALQALEGFNQAHPDIAGVEADALKTGVADLAGAAKNAASAAPEVAQQSIDDVIVALQAKADHDIAQITAERDAQVNALQSAKAAVT